MIRFKIILLIITSLLVSCSNSKYLSTNYEKKKIILNNNLVDISVVEKRDIIDSRLLKIPMLSLPVNHDSISSPISEEQKKRIKEQIVSYFSNSGDSVFVECEILKAIQKFDAHAFDEELDVCIVFRINLYDKNKKLLKSEEGGVDWKQRMLDAHSFPLEKLYLKAIRTSIYNCFEKLTNK